MPALVFYGGCRTFLAGDDLGVFTIVSLTLRCIQLVVVIAISVIVGGKVNTFPSVDELADRCDISVSDVPRQKLVNASYEITVSYLFSAYFTAVFGIILEVLIYTAGAKGTPTLGHERTAWLRPLCCIKMIPLSLLRICNMMLGMMLLSLLQTVCSCAGTLSVDEYVGQCPLFFHWQGWVACLIGTHFTEASFVGLFAIFLLKKGAGHAAGSTLPAILKPETKWKLFCKCCCTVSALVTCCMYGGTDSSTTDFADIGLIMADFFDVGGKLDIVLSDIVLGIRMLARAQKRQQDAARKELMSSIRREVLASPRSDNSSIIHEEKKTTTTDVDVDADDSGGLLAKKNTSTDTMNEDEKMAEYLINHQAADAPSAPPPPPTAPKEERSKRNLGLERRQSVVFQIKRGAGGGGGGDAGGGDEEQAKEQQQFVVQPTVRAVLSADNRQDALVIAEGARFIHLSNSIYEFKISALDTGVMQTCCSIGETGRRRVHWCCAKAEETTENIAPAIIGKRIGAGVRIAKAAERKFLDMAGLADAAVELVYVQFGIGLARQPYCISLDHDWKSIVIAIRGTYSLDDVVADLTILPVSMEEWGKKCGFDGEGSYCHAGMLKASAWIYDDLQAHGILDELLQTRPELSDYTLRLTGHSLGAGCAAILSFLMMSKFPTLRCHCFCPPGCTMSVNMADRCKDYLTSYVFDHDIVPRSTLDSMDHFRDDIFEMVARVKVAKRVALKAKADVSEEDLLYRRDEIPPSMYSEQLRQFHQHQESLRHKRSTRGVPLFPPGQIVHLVRTTEEIAKPPSRGCCLTSSEDDHDDDHDDDDRYAGADVDHHTPDSLDYTAQWADRSDLEEIVISSHMVSDHSAPNMLAELKATAELFGLSPPYVIKEDA